MLVKDYDGSEIELMDLIVKLRYRQDKRRKQVIPIDPDLNIAVCWQGHVRTGLHGFKSCPTCPSPWRFWIVEGKLLSSGGLR